MKMSQQDCENSVKGFAWLILFCVLSTFYVSGPLGILFGFLRLANGDRGAASWLMILYGVAVCILFLVNMIRKKRYLLLLAIFVLLLPVPGIVQAAVAAAVIVVFALLYRGVAKKEKEQGFFALNRFQRWVNAVGEHYMMALLDVFFIRQWCIRKGYCRDLLDMKYGRW